MRAEQHQGKTLRYLTVYPDGHDAEGRYPMVILLHGFGASMADLANLSPAIDPVGYVYVFPNAPLAADIGPGMAGYAWTPPRGTGTPEDAQRAEEALAALFEEVMEKHRVEPGQVVLGGFSQGGMMTYRCGLPKPELFRGLVVLSSRVLDPEGLRPRLPASRAQPIFVAHGTEDPLISVEEARESRQFLEAEGYAPEYREYPMGHAITQDVLADLVPWLHGVLPPASQASQGAAS